MWLPLADSLLTFLKNDAFWQKTSEQSKSWVRENFDIATQAVKLEELYDECGHKWRGRNARRDNQADVETRDT